jgi:hypothetical protein
VGELTLVPDPKNPFTHLAWGSGTSEFILMSRQEVPPLPLDAPWMAFISAKPSFAMASVLESIQYLPVAKPPTLRDSAARFSGQPPHYLFRTFIATETNNAKSLANLKAGDTYSICHWIYCPTSHDDSAEALAQRISLFAKGARKGNRLLVSR